ncbi:hypothetical protein EII46_31425, partial [Klebsiella pneumoniae]|nr:hypothetical protein [Klebsiella pneumoniae]
MFLQGLKSRYCDKCCMYKPSRTHHCKVCKRCVLKMVSVANVCRY